MSSTDRIEKTVEIKAPRSRVWRAVTDAKEFGQWFGVTLHDPFVKGATVRGTFDEAVTTEKIIEVQKDLGLEVKKPELPEKAAVFCTVEKIEPEGYFSFRWIPYDLDGAPAAEAVTTLIEFELEDRGATTRLTIRESGFDRVPPERRERAFRMNDHGWTEQARNIARHVETH